MQVAEPLLPYALAFAAGAMVYVVVDDIIPEAQARFVIGLFDLFGLFGLFVIGLFNYQNGQVSMSCSVL